MQYFEIPSSGDREEFIEFQAVEGDVSHRIQFPQKAQPIQIMSLEQIQRLEDLNEPLWKKFLREEAV